MNQTVVMTHDAKNNTIGLIDDYTQLRPQLLRFLNKCTGDPVLAEDILQEMWIRLRDHCCRSVENPAAYLRRMAANMVVDHVRSGTRQARRDREWVEAQVQRLECGEIADEAPSPDRAVESRDELSRVMRAIEAMPPRASQVFQLHRVHGLRQRDIASRLGVSLSSVEKNMATALKHMTKSSHLAIECC